MDQHANTKNVSEPGQAQNPELQESARQAEEPGDMKTESPRKCSICGGPNHYGCGCEAKQLSEAKDAGLTENEAKALHEPEAPIEDILMDVFSPESIKAAQKATINMAKNTELMVERSGAICDLLVDLCQCTKEITECLKTINENLVKKDEVKKNATENQN